MIASTAQARPSSVVVFNELAQAVACATSAFRSPWLALALQARKATAEMDGVLVLAIGESGKLEAFDESHPGYFTKVAVPGFVCMISPASHPCRIASRLRAAAERNCVAD